MTFVLRATSSSSRALVRFTTREEKGARSAKVCCSYSRPPLQLLYFTISGLAFPTCISVNNTVSHFSPLA